MKRERKQAHRRKKPKDRRPYVADARRADVGPGNKAITWLFMVMLAALVGFVIGFVVFLLMNLSGWLTSLLWNDFGGRLGIPLFPLIVCILGGIVIGLWTRLSKNTIDDLATVMGRFKKTGSYRLDRPAATAVSFLLPLVFGGSVGFEAGLTGIITAGCCWIRDKLKAAGLRAAGIANVTIAATLSAVFRAPLAGLVAGYESDHDEALVTEVGHVDDYNLRHEAKLVLYLAAALGAFGGIAVFNALFGGSSGLPRFDHIEAQGMGFLWLIPCLLAAYVLLLVFHGTKTACELFTRRFEGPTSIVLKPIIAGIIIGTLALAFPLVLFPGEEQCQELMETWGSWAPAALLATGMLKAMATPLCIKLGWKGGDLFPCIFAGVSTGYGIAALTGADPMLLVTVTATAFLAGVTHKPLLTLGILALCFPLDGILWMGIAAIVGAALPLPRFCAKENTPNGGRG